MDLGCTEWVHVSRLRTMQDTFCHLLFQSVDAFLPILPPPGADWSEAAM